LKNVAQLLQLEENCRNSEEIKELAYIIVNETRELVSYDQGVLISNMGNKLSVDAITDVSVVEATSPFTQWVNDVASSLVKLDNADSLHVVNVSNDLNEQQQSEMKDFSPLNFLWLPLKMTRQGVEIEYYLLLFKHTPWQEKEKALLKHIASSYRYFLFSLYKSNFKIWRKSRSFLSKYAKIFIIILILLMFLPIRLTVLSPLEVKAKDPIVVTSPLNGAIDSINVLPDQKVKQGELLVELENLDFKNSYNISERTFEVAKAQLHTTKQNSFIDYKLKSKIAGLAAEVKLKKAEMDFAKSQLDKTIIKADESGTVVINDPNEWVGKPVVVGEKILLIANQKKIQAQIMLPVTDAIFLNENALVKIFFDNDPLNTWHGKISQIYYEPELTPQNILSYKIIADFDQIDENGYIPKIGLRGTAKIYSDEVSLFFYLFKKPITTIRQWIGW